MNISKEAIEAAAEAAINEADKMGVTDVSDAGVAHIARAALEAAAPLLMAQAWDEGRAHGATWPYGHRGLATDDNPYRKETP